MRLGGRLLFLSQRPGCLAALRGVHRRADGFLLNQNAYQAEPTASPALAVITTVGPLVGIGIGLLWLGESINTPGWALALEVISLAVMTGGVLALAYRAPQVKDLPAAEQQAP